jgi:hypothetical protein
MFSPLLFPSPAVSLVSRKCFVRAPLNNYIGDLLSLLAQPPILKKKK